MFVMFAYTIFFFNIDASEIDSVEQIQNMMEPGKSLNVFFRSVLFIVM